MSTFFYFPFKHKSLMFACQNSLCKFERDFKNTILCFSVSLQIWNRRHVFSKLNDFQCQLNIGHMQRYWEPQREDSYAQLYLAATHKARFVYYYCYFFFASICMCKRIQGCRFCNMIQFTMCGHFLWLFHSIFHQKLLSVFARMVVKGNQAMKVRCVNVVLRVIRGLA